MTRSAGDDPEQLLSSALRAQAGSGPAQAPQEPTDTGSAHGSTRAPQPTQRTKLPVVRVLLIAAATGVLAGVLAAVLTLI